jgi:hypothetical protein
MNVFFVLTIDVEPDCTASWQYRSPLSFNGVTIGVRDVLQPLFDRHNIRPTYLINNVVLEDEESISVFKAIGTGCELGTHLHPEFVEPEKLYADYAGKEGIRRQCLYRPEIERAKLETITKMFVKAFGYAPVSFRAGRFSAQGNTIRCLYELGYSVDTSVTPHVLWVDKNQPIPIDFRYAPEQPYFARADCITAEDERSGILEVPVSISPIYPWRLKHWKLRPFRSLFKKHAVWLRPSNYHFDDLKLLTEAYCEAYKHNANIFLNMMFHNVEVLPGYSPYVLTDAQRQLFINTLDRYFEYLLHQDIRCITLSELYGLYHAHSASSTD